MAFNPGKIKNASICFHNTSLSSDAKAHFQIDTRFFVMLILFFVMLIFYAFTTIFYKRRKSSHKCCYFVIHVVAIAFTRRHIKKLIFFGHT